LRADKFDAAIVSWFLHNFRFTPQEAAKFVSTTPSGPFEGNMNVLAPDVLFEMGARLPLDKQLLSALLARAEECASRIGPFAMPGKLTQRAKVQLTPRTFPLLFSATLGRCLEQQLSPLSCGRPTSRKRSTCKSWKARCCRFTLAGTGAMP
jgi:hypothetical protein